MNTMNFVDSGIVPDRYGDGSSSDEYTSSDSDNYDGFRPREYACVYRDLLKTKIPVATWRGAELAFYCTKIPIAKWRLREFYMEKKNKQYRGCASSFGFKKTPEPKVASNLPLPQPRPAPPVITDSNESINSNVKNCTPRLTRPKKENSTNLKPNRFGFRGPSALSNKVADSQNDSTKTSIKIVGEEAVKSVVRSHLPRPQFPVRLANPAGFRSRTASVDKNAKTAANNHTARRSRSEHGGSSASSVNDADSGVGSQKSGNELEMIEQLECSPSARNRLRSAQKSRPMEMIFPTGNEKKFELRELRDGIEVTEITHLELPALPLGKRLPQGQGLVRERAKAYTRQLSRESASSEDEGIDDESGEEKLYRDRVLSEKEERSQLGGVEEGAGEEEAEDLSMWGHGEAMVGEEDMEGGQDLESDLDDAPDSPGSPTHASNSLSLSDECRDRDFIDDEICDQPGLVYDNLAANSSGNTLIADSPSPRPHTRPSPLANLTVDCESVHQTPSVGTLSPCESIASDDLIMDFDLSAVDDDHRLETSSLDLALTDGEGDYDGEEGADHTLLSASRPDVLEGTWLVNGVRATRQLRRVGSSGSHSLTAPDSPRSLDTPTSRLRSGSALSSPLRSSRQGTSSPGEDLSDDSGIRVNRGTYQAMYQDVINIKALLLRLSRVVQEQSASENTIETVQKNGFYPAEQSQQEVIAELQRQKLFLQSQLEERDRTIRALQTAAAQTVNETRLGGAVDTCNAATQTERIRPLSTGPILTSTSDSTGASFVSFRLGKSFGGGDSPRKAEFLI